MTVLAIEKQPVTLDSVRNKSELGPIFLNRFVAIHSSSVVVRVEFNGYLTIDPDRDIFLMEYSTGYFELRDIPKKQNFPRLTEIICQGKSNGTQFRKQMVKIRDFFFLNCIITVICDNRVLRVRDHSDVISFRVSKANFQSIISQLKKYPKNYGQRNFN